MITENNNESVQTTDLGTLWSETLLEMLNDAVRNNWSNNAVLEILKELRNKGYKVDRVARKLRKRFGQEAADRLLNKLRAR